MVEDQDIPKSEPEGVDRFNKFTYKAISKIGLTSGIGLVAWGAWWFIWTMIAYLGTTAQSAMQQVVRETYFSQAQLSAILIALGVVIMEMKRLKQG